MSARPVGADELDELDEQLSFYLAAEPDATPEQIAEAVDEYLARDEVDPMPADMPERILERLDRMRVIEGL